MTRSLPQTLARSRVTSAMTRSRPPQSGQIDRSIANTRLVGRHTAFHPAHRCSRCRRIVLTISIRRLHPSVSSRAPSAGPSRRVRHHRTAMFGVGGKDAVVSHVVTAWPRDQRREPGKKLDRLEHKMAGAVPVRAVTSPVSSAAGSSSMSRPTHPSLGSTLFISSTGAARDRARRHRHPACESTHRRW